VHPHPDEETFQPPDITFTADNDHVAGPDPPNEDLVPEQLFHRCGVWRADGQPVLHNEIEAESDEGDQGEDTVEFLDDDNDNDNNDNDNDIDIPDEGEFLSEPWLRGMSALDELALDFERERASGAIPSLI
jgi:hypothetical protein